MWKLLLPRSTAASTSGTGRRAARTTDLASARRALTAVGTRKGEAQLAVKDEPQPQVRVANDELRAVEPLAVIDLRSGQVLHAHRVDDELDALVLDAGVAVLQLLVELEPVLQPGAAAALHENAQHQLRIAFTANEVAHLAGGGVGEEQRGRWVLKRSVCVDGGGHNLLQPAV